MTSTSSLEVVLDSPKLMERALDAKIHLREVQLENKQKNKERDREWKSCCLVVDKDMVQFISQVGVLGSIIMFSCYNIAYERNVETMTSLLTFCIGILIPNPKLN